MKTRYNDKWVSPRASDSISVTVFQGSGSLTSCDLKPFQWFPNVLKEILSFVNDCILRFSCSWVVLLRLLQPTSNDCRCTERLFAFVITQLHFLYLPWNMLLITLTLEEINERVWLWLCVSAWIGLPGMPIELVDMIHPTTRKRYCNAVWDYMTISILTLLHLPDDVPTMDTPRIFSTGFRAFSQNHILVIFTNVFKPLQPFFLIWSLIAIYHVSNGHQQQTIEYSSSLNI